MKILFLFFVLSSLGCSNFPGAETPPETPGETIAIKVCSTCHGIAGESVSPLYPKLGGQQKDYLIQQLVDFKGHFRKNKRGVERMWGYTHLTQEQIQQIADYFSSQSPMRGKEKAPSDQLRRGEYIFLQGLKEIGVAQCNTCHGPQGEGNGIIPRIAGQHADYTFRQIEVYQKTEDRPHGALMKQVTTKMSEADMKAVAEYIETLGASGHRLPK